MTDKYILIHGRYVMHEDGCVYDSEKGNDIPVWIFRLRDFILDNYKSMVKFR